MKTYYVEWTAWFIGVALITVDVLLVVELWARRVTRSSDVMAGADRPALARGGALHGPPRHLRGGGTEAIRPVATSPRALPG